jgi:hypothetical protein
VGTCTPLIRAARPYQNRQWRVTLLALAPRDADHPSGGAFSHPNPSRTWPPPRETARFSGGRAEERGDAPECPRPRRRPRPNTDPVETPPPDARRGSCRRRHCQPRQQPPARSRDVSEALIGQPRPRPCIRKRPHRPRRAVRPNTPNARNGRGRAATSRSSCSCGALLVLRSLGESSRAGLGPSSSRHGAVPDVPLRIRRLEHAERGVLACEHPVSIQYQLA